MDINTIINNLTLEDCFYNRGSIEWANKLFNLTSNYDGIKCYVKTSELIHAGRKGFVIGKHTDILTAINIQFKKCVGFDKIPEYDDIPMKLTVCPPNVENSILHDLDTNEITYPEPSIYQKIELYNFQDNSLQLNEPLILNAFPRNFESIIFNTWGICVEFNTPFLNDYVIDITTAWIDLKVNHPTRTLLANREFISDYLEYTENEIKKKY